MYIYFILYLFRLYFSTTIYLFLSYSYEFLLSSLQLEEEKKKKEKRNLLINNKLPNVYNL